MENALEDIEVHPPSRHAKWAIGISLSSLAGVLIFAATFGVKIGAKQEAFDNVQRDIAVLKVEKADKELLESQLAAIQKSQDEMKKQIDRLVNRQLGYRE